MGKRIENVLVFGIAIFIIGSGISSEKSFECKFDSKPESKSTSGDDPNFVPEDIALQDGAFHKSNVLAGQWWYFDAVFDNGYSIQLGITVISKGANGLIFPKLNIYKDTNLKAHAGKVVLFSQFWASENTPFIKLYGKQVMRGYIYENTGKWIYDVSLEIDDQAANLRFIGTMKGWKGKLPGSWWGVMLPKASVTGNITSNGVKINVVGEGYHEHSWDVFFPIKENGWYWGKIVGSTLNVVWSKIMQNRWWGQPIAVLNKGSLNYININSEYFYFNITKYKYYERKLIPIGFTLQANYNSLHIDIKMEAVNIHHVRIAILNYWRYHVRVTGTVSIGVDSEKIDNIQIMELMRLR